MSGVGDTARDARHVLIRGPDFGARLRLDELADDGVWRVERPALRSDGDRLEVAALAYEHGNAVVVRACSDDGTTWDQARRVASIGSVFPHITPVWVGDVLVYAVLDEGGAKVCADRDGDRTCAALETEHLLQLQADGETLLALVDVGGATWEVVEVPVP